LYRGEEHTFELTSFRKLKVEFAKVRSVEAQICCLAACQGVRLR